MFPTAPMTPRSVYDAPRVSANTGSKKVQVPSPVALRNMVT